MPGSYLRKESTTQVPKYMGFENRVEVEFASWQNLVAALVSTPSRGWIFRGLSHYSYSPLSKLERTLSTAGIPPQQWRSRENLGLAFFKDRARHYLSELPNERDLLGWLSLMQHYGAPTRLTDWTVSPFVACYFAYESAPPNPATASGNDGATLWMLNAAQFSRVYGTSFPFGRDHMGTVCHQTCKDGQVVERTYPGREITTDHVAAEQNDLLRDAIESEINWPLPLPILRPDRRMAAQQACFVCSGKLSSSPGRTAIELLMREENWKAMEAEMNKIGPRPGSWHAAGNVLLTPDMKSVRHVFQDPWLVVGKVRLPHAWRTEALASLAKMNITADSLFPGLDGVGKTAEVYMQIGAPASMREYLGL